MKILDKELLKRIILEEKAKLEKDIQEGRVSLSSKENLDHENKKSSEKEELPNAVMEDYDRWTKLSGIFLKD
tara:strand:+ start:18923 stop:19138 length:216 start_codon:yes stop_codon:yes gene_type:complete